MHHDAGVDEVWNLRGHPRREAEAEGVCDPKFGRILRPKGLEVHREADLATSVHLGCLPVELRQLQLDRGLRVRNGNLELEVELILEEIVDYPALARPFRACEKRKNVRAQIAMERLVYIRACVR